MVTWFWYHIFVTTYGTRYENITCAGAVDREFVYTLVVELTLDGLWLLWGALGLPLAVLWGPFGRPGAYAAWVNFLKMTYDCR